MATDPSTLIAGLLQGGGIGQQITQNSQQDQAGDQALQMGQLQLAQKSQANQQDQEEHQAVKDFWNNPTLDGVDKLQSIYPTHAVAYQKIYDNMEETAKQSNITQNAQLLNAAQNGRTDLLTTNLTNLQKAEKDKGIDTSNIDDALRGLQSGDPDQIAKATKFITGQSLINLRASGAKGFETASPDTKGTVVGRSVGHYDGNKWVLDYRDPESAQYRSVDGVDDDGNPVKQLVQIGGDQAGSAATAAAPGANGGTGQPLSVRLNNPGAIRFDPKNQWQGQTGQQNGFAQFDTPANGSRAHQILISNQIKEGYDTPATWAAHYAPSADGNDPAAYAATVAKGLGIGINDKIPVSAVPKMASLSAQVEAGGSSGSSPGGGAQPAALVGSPTMPGVKVIYTSKAPASTGQDAATVDFYGQKVAAGGDMPQLGMGKQAAAMRQAILARSAQIQQGQGMTGGDSNLLHADVKTATTALGALQKTRNSLNPFLQTFDGASAQVRALAPQGVGGSAPIFNRWIQAGRTNLQGDPAVSKFNVAINAVANENAKIMSGASGGAISSDSARHEAMGLINNAQTLDQLNGVLDQMHTDTQIRMQSLDDRQAALRNVVAGKGSGAPGASTTNQPGSSSAPAPRIGAVVRGYRFNGGNPRDRNNWAPAQ
jgi:hypothetical protein